MSHGNREQNDDQTTQLQDVLPGTVGPPGIFIDRVAVQTLADYEMLCHLEVT